MNETGADDEGGTLANPLEATFGGVDARAAHAEFQQPPAHPPAHSHLSSTRRLRGRGTSLRGAWVRWIQPADPADSPARGLASLYRRRTLRQRYGVAGR